MSKFGGLFARKPSVLDTLAQPSPTGTVLPINSFSDPAPGENPLELDEELFSTLGAQVGGDNETLRNLLLDANAKIGELDAIKAAPTRPKSRKSSASRPSSTTPAPPTASCATRSPRSRRRLRSSSRNAARCARN
jgi:hypothetical protein